MELLDITDKSVRATIRDALVEIQEANPDGLLVAKDVVDTARPSDHPLHPHFTWDDTLAGERFRLIEAGRLIRCIKVENPEASKPASVPKYVSLMTDRKREGGGYRETGEVIMNDELRAELEETARRDLEGWLRRNAALTELCEAVRKAAGIKDRKPAKARR